MTSDDDWIWKFAPRATDQFDSLDPHVQDRIVSKLDEVTFDVDIHDRAIEQAPHQRIDE